MKLLYTIYLYLFGILEKERFHFDSLIKSHYLLIDYYTESVKRGNYCGLCKAVKAMPITEFYSFVDYSYLKIYMDTLVNAVRVENVKRGINHGLYIFYFKDSESRIKLLKKSLEGLKKERNKFY